MESSDMEKAWLKVFTELLELDDLIRPSVEERMLPYEDFQSPCYEELEE